MRFHEEQGFRGTWLKIFSVGLIAPIPIAAIVLFVAVPDLRDDPWLLSAPLVLVFLLDLGIWLALWRSRLVVDVAADRVVAANRPFFTQTIPAARIAAVRWQASGLRRRYGAGFGKRWGAKRIRLTVGNDAGVVLTLTDGWTVVIGSERPEELGEAIRDLVRDYRPDLTASAVQNAGETR